MVLTLFLVTFCKTWPRCFLLLFLALGLGFDLKSASSFTPTNRRKEFTFIDFPSESCRGRKLTHNFCWSSDRKYSRISFEKKYHSIDYQLYRSDNRYLIPPSFFLMCPTSDQEHVEERGQLQNQNGKIQGADEEKEWGVLFDMDGTMTISDHFHFEVFQIFLEPYLGYRIDQEFFEKHIHGGSNALIFRSIFPDEKEFPDAKLVEMAEEKEALFRELVRKHGVKEVEGLSEFLAWIKINGGKIGCVTNAPRQNAETVLNSMDLTYYVPNGEGKEVSDERNIQKHGKYGEIKKSHPDKALYHFETLVIGDECSRAKPFPDPYLQGAANLALPMNKLFIFEDSPSGCKSALEAMRQDECTQTAEMENNVSESNPNNSNRVIGVRSSLTETNFQAIGIEKSIENFQDQTIKEYVLENIFK